MADPQKQLDALVSDVGKCTDVCKNAVVGLIAVGVASMHCNVSMPIATTMEDKVVTMKCIV